jgi:tRNA (cytidine/uridine-2'-O-)-methyltransferase
MTDNPPIKTDISIAMYCPDMPQNVGAAMRLSACMNAPLHIIEPCGFIWKEKEFRRSGMDYISLVDLTRHNSWNSFLESLSPKNRIILMTTKGATPLYNFQFQDGDVILLGQESSGAPEEVHERADARIVIPMHGTARSLNIVNSASIALGEAVRQIRYN